MSVEALVQRRLADYPLLDNFALLTCSPLQRQDVQMIEGRDVWWQDAVEKQNDECEVR